MFVISLRYIKSLSEVDAFIPAHITYLNLYYDRGIFLASGRKVPRTGGVIMAKAASKKQIEEIIKQDPFYIEGIAEYDIMEFTPTMTAPSLAFLKEEPLF